MDFFPYFLQDHEIMDYFSFLLQDHEIMDIEYLELKKTTEKIIMRQHVDQRINSMLGIVCVSLRRQAQ